MLFTSIKERFPSPYGDFVFQRQERKMRYEKILHKFPSPYGDFVFQQFIMKYIEQKLDKRVSVPLRGFCFSTQCCNHACSCCMQVSVPLRGFCFSTPQPLPTVVCPLGGGFRPLTGILFFNNKELRKDDLK